MSENLHDIDKLFRDGIEGQEDTPSAKVWDAVDASLDKNNVVHIKRKYNNLKKLAAVLLLLLMSVAGYEIFKSKESNKEVVSNNRPAVKSTDNAQPGDNATVKNNTPLTNHSANNYSVEEKPAVSENTVTGKTVVENRNDVSNTFGTSNAGKQDVSSTNNVSKKKDNKKQLGTNAESTSVGAEEDDALKFYLPEKSVLKNRTKIKVKSPAAQQSDDNVAENNEVNNVTEHEQWVKADNSSAATLARRINNAVAENEKTVTSRQAPDVNTANLKMRNPMRLKFSIMPFASPQFAFTSLKEDDRYNNPSPGGPPPPRPGRDNHKEQYKGDEETQNSFTTGVLGQLQFGKKWGIQSGIVYTTKNITIEPKKIYARPDKDGQVKYVYDCSSGYSYLTGKTGTTPAAGDSINASSSKNLLAYIGIPVMANYKISLGKFSIIPAAGAVFNILTRQKIQTELQQGTSKLPQTINKIEGLKSSYINATMGLALEYDIIKKMSVNIMPAANFAITAINKDAAVKSYPNSFGMSCGLKFKF
jgi:hypothetical protein